jgi:hypothetical protein
LKTKEMGFFEKSGRTKMNPKQMLAGRYWRTLLVMLCFLARRWRCPRSGICSAASGAGGRTCGSTCSPDQLDSLVAPIALYPDPLLAQTLAASTYPLKSFSSSNGSRKTRT